MSIMFCLWMHLAADYGRADGAESCTALGRVHSTSLSDEARAPMLAIEPNASISAPSPPAGDFERCGGRERLGRDPAPRLAAERAGGVVRSL